MSSSDVFLPPWIEPEAEVEKPIDESAVFRHAFAPGVAQRNEYGGLRPQLSRRHTARAEERAVLLATLRATRGTSKTVRTKLAQLLRGSFPAAELLSNTTFPGDSTAGWSSSNAAVVLSCNDRTLRATRVQVTADHTVRAPSFNVASGYFPHVFRVMVLAGRGPLNFSTRMGTTAGNNDVATGAANQSVQGLYSLVGVPPPGTAHVSINDDFEGRIAGDYYDVPYASVSRCLQVDNAPNLLLQSDEFDATWTATRASVDDQAATAPDGTGTADSIIEDASNNTHFVSQSVTVSSAAADFSFGVALKAGGRNWAQVVITEDTASTSVHVYANLAVGTLGSVNGGANFANARAFIRSLGDGWYMVHIVGRKTNAATSITARIGLATADLTNSYTGDGTSNILAWRATLAQSGVPTRLSQTTTSALPNGTAQTGGGIHVKGLPVSTNGLFLPQDPFEINAELKFAAASLNSDAAGLGYLQFEPPLVESPADGDPVIVLDPMGRFLVSSLSVDNEFGVQSRISYDLEHVYDP